MNFGRLLERGKTRSRQLRRSGAGRHTPTQRLGKIIAVAERPGKRRGQRVARTDGLDRFHARRSGFKQLIRPLPMDGSNRAPASERQHDGFRAHRPNAADGGQRMRPREQHGVEQPFRFLLVRRYDSGAGLDAA